MEKPAMCEYQKLDMADAIAKDPRKRFRSIEGNVRRE